MAVGELTPDTNRLDFLPEVEAVCLWCQGSEDEPRVVMKAVSTYEAVHGCNGEDTEYCRTICPVQEEVIDYVEAGCYNAFHHDEPFDPTTVVYSEPYATYLMETH